MSIKKRSINEDRSFRAYKATLISENDSSPENFSRLSNLPTNFNLKTITLEDCDQAVFLEFHKRFKIGENFQSIILLDAELTSLKEQNYEQYDKARNSLSGPFFTMIRKESKPKYRTNPSIKKVVYAIPISKPDGVIIEEYIYDGPISYDLIYEFKFISSFREYSNKFEEQFRYYFRNRRNIIVCKEERFSIGPVDPNSFSSFEIRNSDTADQKSFFVSTYELKLECFIRDLTNMQKRERPNKIHVDFNVKDSKNDNAISAKHEFTVFKKPETNNKPEDLS